MKPICGTIVARKKVRVGKEGKVSEKHMHLHSIWLKTFNNFILFYFFFMALFLSCADDLIFSFGCFLVDWDGVSIT